MANYTEQFFEDAKSSRPALKLDDVVMTYGELDDAVGRAAGLLRGFDVEAGDRVGLQLPNELAFPIFYLAVLRLGAVVVPMNPLLKEREVAHQLSDSGARLVIAWHESEQAAVPAAQQTGAACLIITPTDLDDRLDEAGPVDEVTDRDDEDIALIIYTSGTTGLPKGAALSHRNFAVMTDTIRELVTITEKSIWLGVLPLFHIFALQYLNGWLKVGGLTTLMRRFDAEQALAVMAEDRVTVFAGVPAMYNGLINVPDRSRFDLSSLALCISGGASLPLEVLRTFDEDFGATILEGYGLSETCGQGAFNRRDRPRKPGSIGLPIDGAEIRLVDGAGKDVPTGERGELVLRAPFVMSGYWRRPEATAEAMRDGWFHTGDVATADDEGYLYIVDRIKDLIIRGGYNIYPREVEEVLYEHPDVREAAVVGVPHPSLGEEVAAFVALKEGALTTPDELRAYVKERMAAYKYPRQVTIVDELPKGPTGKIVKRLIAPSERCSANTE
jgi:long-chain acyl-CoA synthetase